MVINAVMKKNMCVFLVDKSDFIVACLKGLEKTVLSRRMNTKIMICLGLTVSHIIRFMLLNMELTNIRTKNWKNARDDLAPCDFI